MYVCMYVDMYVCRYACMLCMHATYVCMLCMSAVYACMLCMYTLDRTLERFFLNQVVLARPTGEQVLPLLKDPWAKSR